MSRGPAARKSGTSKPRDAPLEAGDALLEQDPLDQLGLGQVAREGDLDELAAGVLGLDLARPLVASVIGSSSPRPT